jgi:hypothetical protein
MFTNESLRFYRNLLGNIEIEANGSFAQGNGDYGQISVTRVAGDEE